MASSVIINAAKMAGNIESGISWRARCAARKRAAHRSALRRRNIAERKSREKRCAAYRRYRLLRDAAALVALR
jgi:hypothetical protein